MGVTDAPTQRVLQKWPDGHAVPRADMAGGEILLDTNFANGPDGFRQLTDTVNPAGYVGWRSDGHMGGGALQLQTANTFDNAANHHSESYAYRRIGRYMQHPDESMRLLLECWWSFGSRYAVSGSVNAGNYRIFEMGLDTAYSTGTRYYPNLRWFCSDDNSNLDGRWYVQTGTPTAPAYTLIPGPDSGTASGSAFSANIQTPLGINENKHDVNYTALAVEFTAAGVVYDGFQINHRAFGSLAGLAAGSNPLRALTAGSVSLGTFAYGLNVGFGHRNRLSTSNAAAETRVHAARLRLLGAAT